MCFLSAQSWLNVYAQITNYSVNLCELHYGEWNVACSENGFQGQLLKTRARCASVGGDVAAGWHTMEKNGKNLRLSADNVTPLKAARKP